MSQMSILADTKILSGEGIGLFAIGIGGYK
jgi:hypothetical protein